MPAIKAPGPDDKKRIQELESDIASLEAALKAGLPDLDRSQMVWEKTLPSRSRTIWKTLTLDKLQAKGANPEGIAGQVDRRRGNESRFGNLYRWLPL